MTLLRAPRLASVAMALLLAAACGGDTGTDVQEVATVTVAPATASVASLGATAQLTASARDASGNAVRGATFTWSTSAAGVPDILVEFAGTWDAETQTLEGTYTIDSEKVIVPGHPVVYEVNVSGG